jgi:hypothetical protein
MSMKSILTAATVGAIFVAAGAANASTLAFQTQSDFIASATGSGAPSNQVADQVNWADFDASLGQQTQNGSIAYGSSMTTIAGEGITVIQSSSPHVGFTTYVEGQAFVNGGTAGWDGQFAGGTTVLYNGSNTHSVTLTFGTAISGLGVDLQTKNAGAYSFTITAFNSNNVAIGTAIDSGTSIGSGSGNGTGSEGTVKFAGITSSADDISFVTISSTNNSSGFAIDTSLIYHANINGTSNPVGGGGTQTPEPGTIALLGAGLAALGAVRRRRNRAA